MCFLFLSTEQFQRHLQNARDIVGRGGRSVVCSYVPDGRQRGARFRGCRQSDRQVAKSGHADTDFPVFARRERQAARLSTEAELRLVHGRRSSGHLSVRPSERVVRCSVRDAVHRGQEVRDRGTLQD